MVQAAYSDTTNMYTYWPIGPDNTASFTIVEQDHIANSWPSSTKQILQVEVMKYQAGKTNGDPNTYCCAAEGMRNSWTNGISNHMVFTGRRYLLRNVGITRRARGNLKVTRRTSVNLKATRKACVCLTAVMSSHVVIETGHRCPTLHRFISCIFVVH